MERAGQFEQIVPVLALNWPSITKEVYSRNQKLKNCWVERNNKLNCTFFVKSGIFPREFLQDYLDLKRSNLNLLSAITCFY